MENFSIESRNLKVCNEFRTVIRFMKDAFYRPDYQKLLMYPLIETLGRAFVPKHAAEPLKHLVKLFKHSDELLKHLAELSRIWEKSKSSAESLKSTFECLKTSAACLCFNTVHAVPISHGMSHAHFPDYIILR